MDWLYLYIRCFDQSKNSVTAHRKRERTRMVRNALMCC